MKIKIDYFSDTNVTPSKEMLNYMIKAKVGNEAACEDPTTNDLIEKTCQLLGKESAIFLPTGTMANSIAYRTHCDRPGDIIVLDETSHSLKVQSGSIGGLVHANSYTISVDRGIFTKEQISPIVKRGVGRNLPRIRLVSVEQTTNFGGGTIWPMHQIKDISYYCKDHGILTHLDGARIFNASAVTGISVKDYCQYFDSVYIDFAKGLGAPIGAILAGSKNFIEKAWYYKFQQGGSLHQSGILAAACIFALDNNIKNLVFDHEKIKILAEGLDNIPWIKIDKELYKTNILYFKLQNTKYTTKTFIDLLLKHKIRMLALDDKIRVITHMDISFDDVYETIKIIKNIFN
ncbi:threonine aldolase family protein [Rickettsiales endosymbiont of Trichoplax sp. H2]|uniref:threonine aldolase family protein n=1 Tax=Rickettsiales endosymbiont of Trichoplax sp. H2 TaxID=2021221 RepID=UPI0012B1E46A|nr:GntG family PLP-dependent aldolase [Rickettsiales endosymbiont of Trichoplax sp. H2]MSO14541.1 L-allo-threonine aldolase [Rickettsiales endosymbiont of Trichoplax sp. H2]